MVNGSPVNDHPFCLFDKQEDGSFVLKMNMVFQAVTLILIMSPWGRKAIT